MEDTTATRQATRARIGPWYVLQQRNPSAPGMRFDTLLTLVKRGQISPRSIVRGPTTHQLWRFAARVRGLSRQFGLCYSCGHEIETTATLCGQCHKMQEPPMNPDVLLEAKSPAPATLPVRREIPAEAEPRVAADLILPTLGGIPSTSSTASALPAPPDATPPAPASSAAAPSLASQRPQTPHARPEPAPNAVAAASPTARASRPSPAARPRPETAASPPQAPRTADKSDSVADNAADDHSADHAGDSNTRPILSAKELAAAFKLDFILQPDEVAAATRPHRRHRHRLAKTIALLLLLGAGMLAGALYFSPSFRQQALDRTRQTYAHLRERWSALRSPPPASGAASHATPPGASAAGTRSDQPTHAASAHSGMADMTDTADKDSANPPAAPLLGIAPQKTATPPLSLRHLPLPAGPSIQADAPARTSPPDAAHSDAAPPSATASKSGPWDQLQAASDKTAPTAPKDTHAAPPVPAAEKSLPPITDGDHSEEIRQLWISAIDAEGRGNYPQAVKLYDQIKRYPQDQWPVSLELRLEQVKKQMEEKK
jgi:hypothetical protein